MKVLLVAAAFTACFANGRAKAQTVNKVRLSDIKSEYIQVKGIKRTFSSKVLISVAYGQNISYLDDTYIRDDNGEKMEFESALEFVNKSKSYGYELFQVFSELTGKDTSIPVYVLKRK